MPQMYEAKNKTAPYELFVQQDESISNYHSYRWMLFMLDKDGRWYSEVASATLDIVPFKDDDAGSFFRDSELTKWNEQIERIKEKYGDKLEAHFSEKK